MVSQNIGDPGAHGESATEDEVLNDLRQALTGLIEEFAFPGSCLSPWQPNAAASLRLWHPDRPGIGAAGLQRMRCRWSSTRTCRSHGCRGSRGQSTHSADASARKMRQGADPVTSATDTAEPPRDFGPG